MPNENSFDPDICGSKRPTYPEKDRFEELYSKLAMNCFDEINDWEQTISEMREIYRALKQENLQLVETIKTLRDSKISVSKAPSRWIDEIVDSLRQDFDSVEIVDELDFDNLI